MKFSTRWGIILAVCSLLVVVFSLQLTTSVTTEQAVAPAEALANAPEGAPVPQTGTNPLLKRFVATTDDVSAVENALTHELRERQRIALERWPNATLVRAAQTAVRSDGTLRRVSIIQPVDLPYRVRIEDILSLNPVTGEETVIQRMEAVADHLLVNLADADAIAAAEAALAPLNATLGRALNRRGLHRIHIQDDGLDALPEWVAHLSHEEAFRFAEPDYIVHATASPNDPRYIDGSLWGLHNTGQNGGLEGADINAAEGWAIRNAASTVIVGVVDTGIRLTHEDLSANLWINPNETADGTDSDGNGFIDDLHGINAIALTGDPSDDQGHGTHVAGTIGAVGNNGVGVTGVAWNVQLMGLKFLSAGGGGATSDAIICIDYGVEQGAHILNNSWGGGFFSQALLDSVKAARDAGVLFVVASGNASSNNDNEPVYPASLPVDNVIAVASTTRNDTVSNFSNVGQGSVDIAAPGSEILSTGYEHDASYVSKNGTSMAAPHVAGALALLRAEFPEDSPYQLINRLYSGVDQIPALDGGVVGTSGRLNLHKSLIAGTNRPANDDFANARVVHGDRAILRVGLHAATAEPGEPAIVDEAAPNSIWFSFTPAASGLASVMALAGESFTNPMSGQVTRIDFDSIPIVIGVFTGDSLEDLTPVTMDADNVSFTAVGNTTYHIAVAGEGGAEGLIMLDFTGPPRNSTLANALAIDLGRTQFGTNRNALSEAGEPAHAGNPASASVWYRWTANVTANVAFSTRGSSFDTVAAVYSGPANNSTFANLVPIAANDNAPGTVLNFSRVEFQAIAGTTYYFVIDGKNGASGNVSMSFVIPPGNDKFANAFVLTGTDVSRNVNTSFASREEGEPIHWPNGGRGETVWYVWTAPENGRTNIDLSASFFRGIIAVYTGNSLQALEPVTSDGASNRFAQVVFEATQGTTYRIAVDSWDFSITNAPLRLRMVPTPPNDKFADATQIDGLRATATGSNVGATREPGEPAANLNSGASVWYRWTAPVSGEFGIYGERLNKPDQWIIVLNVFTGSEVRALTHVREDQQNGIGRDAFARFNATAGTTYHIQVTGLSPEGIAGGTGPFRLDLRPSAEHAPVNDSFANAIELDASPIFNYRTQNYGATAEPGEGQHSGYDAYRSLWWKLAVPPGMAGRYAVATSLSEGSLGTTIYRANNPAAPALGQLTQVASNVEFANQNFPDVAWNAEEGNVYYIVVDNYQGALGRVLFNFQKVPANITFSNATIIPEEGLEEITYNWGSLRQHGEPEGRVGIDTLGNRSLWWQWTAPESGRYEVTTAGSRLAVAEDRPISRQFGNATILGMGTILAVYTGSSLYALSPVASNDAIGRYATSPWSFQRNSRVEFDAVAGRTYRILVNGNAFGMNDQERELNTIQGEIHFRFAKMAPPENDDFANASIISGTEFHTITSTHGATRESGEPQHGGINAGRTLWWQWTAPESGPFIVSTTGNIYDDYNARRTGIGVYTGNTVDSLTTIASDQNGAGVNTGEFTWSAAAFNAVAGVTYYFGVDAVHSGNLSFILTRPAPNDNFADATEMRGSRWRATGHNLLTTVEPGEGKTDVFHNPPPVTDASVRSVWWRWTAPVSGTIHLDSLGSQLANMIDVYTGSAIGKLTPVVGPRYRSGDFINGESHNRARNASDQLTFDAVAGTTYHISVQGSGYTDVSSGPIVLTLAGPPAVPFTPENFTARRVTDTRINLTWTDVAVDEEFYEIERSTDGTAWLPLHQSGPNAESFADFDTRPESAIFYRIRAVNSVGQSDWVTASVDATSFSQWLERFFGSSGPNPDTAFDADPDGDGIVNLLEYALAGNPLVASSATAPKLGIVTRETGYHLTLTFLRARPDLIYTVVASNNLAPDSWPVIATNPGEVDLNNPVTVTDPQPIATNPHRFLHLRVSED